MDCAKETLAWSLIARQGPSVEKVSVHPLALSSLALLMSNVLMESVRRCLVGIKREEQLAQRENDVRTRGSVSLTNARWFNAPLGISVQKAYVLVILASE